MSRYDDDPKDLIEDEDEDEDDEGYQPTVLNLAQLDFIVRHDEIRADVRALRFLADRNKKVFWNPHPDTYPAIVALAKAIQRHCERLIDALHTVRELEGREESGGSEGSGHE